MRSEGGSGNQGEGAVLDALAKANHLQIVRRLKGQLFYVKGGGFPRKGHQLFCSNRRFRRGESPLSPTWPTFPIDVI